MWEFWNIIQGITPEEWEQIKQAQDQGFDLDEEVDDYAIEQGYYVR